MSHLDKFLRKQETKREVLEPVRAARPFEYAFGGNPEVFASMSSEEILFLVEKNLDFIKKNFHPDKAPQLKVSVEVLTNIQKQVNNAIRDIKEAKVEKKEVLETWVRAFQEGTYLSYVQQRERSSEEVYQKLYKKAYVDFALQQERIIEELKALKEQNKKNAELILQKKKSSQETQQQILMGLGISNVGIHSEVLYGSKLSKDDLQIQLDHETEKLSSGRDIMYRAVQEEIAKFIETHTLQVDEPFVMAIKNSFLNTLNDDICIAIYEHQGKGINKILLPLQKQLDDTFAQIQSYRNDVDSTALVPVEQQENSASLPLLSAFFAHPAFTPLFSLQHLPLLLTVANNFLKQILLQVHSDKKGAQTKEITKQIVRAMESIELIKNQKDRDTLIAIWEYFKESDIFHKLLVNWNTYDAKTTHLKEVTSSYKNRLVDLVQEKNVEHMQSLQQEKILQMITQIHSVTNEQYKNVREKAAEKFLLTVVNVYAKRLRKVFREEHTILSVQKFLSGTDATYTIDNVLEGITKHHMLFNKHLSSQIVETIQEQFPILEYTFEHVLKTYLYQAERYISVLSAHLLDLSPTFEPLVKKLEEFCIEQLQKTNLGESLIMAAFDSTIASLDKDSIDHGIKNMSHVRYVASVVEVLSLGGFFEEKDIPHIQDILLNEFISIIKEKFLHFYHEEHPGETKQWEDIIYEGNKAFMRKQIKMLLAKKHAQIRKVPTHDKNELARMQSLWIDDILMEFDQKSYDSLQDMFQGMKEIIQNKSVHAFHIHNHTQFQQILAQWRTSLVTSSSLESAPTADFEVTDTAILQHNFKYYLESFRYFDAQLRDMDWYKNGHPKFQELRVLIADITKYSDSSTLTVSVLRNLFQNMYQFVSSTALRNKQEILVLLQEDINKLSSYHLFPSLGTIRCNKEDMERKLAELVDSLIASGAIRIQNPHYRTVLLDVLSQFARTEHNGIYKQLLYEKNKLKGRLSAVDNELQQIKQNEKKLAREVELHTTHTLQLEQTTNAVLDLVCYYIQCVQAQPYLLGYEEVFLQIQHFLKSVKSIILRAQKIEIARAKEVHRAGKRKKNLEERKIVLEQDIKKIDVDMQETEKIQLRVNLNALTHVIQQYFLFGGKIYHLTQFNTYFQTIKDKIDHISQDKNEAFEYMVQLMRGASIKKKELSKAVLSLSTADRYRILQKFAHNVGIEKDHLQNILAEVTQRMLTPQHMMVQGGSFRKIINEAYITSIEKYLYTSMQTIPKQNPLYIDRQYIDIHTQKTEFKNKILMYLKYKMLTDEVFKHDVKDSAFPIETDEIIQHMNNKAAGDTFFMHSTHLLENLRKVEVPNMLDDDVKHMDDSVKQEIIKRFEDAAEHEYSTFHYHIQTLHPHKARALSKYDLKKIRVRDRKSSKNVPRVKMEYAMDTIYPLGSIPEEKYTTFLEELLPKSTELRDQSILFGQGLSLSLRVFFKSKIFEHLDVQINPGDLLLVYSMNDHKVKVAGKILGKTAYEGTIDEAEEIEVEKQEE